MSRIARKAGWPKGAPVRIKEPELTTWQKAKRVFRHYYGKVTAVVDVVVYWSFNFCVVLGLILILRALWKE